MIKFLKDLFKSKSKSKSKQSTEDTEDKLYNPKVEITLTNYIFANSKSIDPKVNLNIKVIFDIKINNKPYYIIDNFSIGLHMLNSKNLISYVKDSNTIDFNVVKLLNNILGLAYSADKLCLISERVTKNILKLITDHFSSEKWNKEIILIRETKLKELIEFMNESGFTYKDIRNYQMLE